MFLLLLFAFHPSLIGKIMTDLSPLMRVVRLAFKPRPYLFVLVFLMSVDASARSEQAKHWRASADEQSVVEVANPRLHNPIAPSEKNRGGQVAESSDTLKRARQEALGRPRPRGLEKLANVQPLFVSHHDEGKNADPQSRKADVVYYDYTNNQSITVVVDLKNNTVKDTIVTRSSKYQPYFTRPEITAAMQLIFNHPQTGPILRKAYLDVAGQQLTDVNQLATQGGIFFPDKHSELGRLAANCATERCMPLFIPIDDTHFIDATNVVVNLSSGEVLWVKQGISGHSH